MISTWRAEELCCSDGTIKEVVFPSASNDTAFGLPGNGETANQRSRGPASLRLFDIADGHGDQMGINVGLDVTDGVAPAGLTDFQRRMMSRARKKAKVGLDSMKPNLNFYYFPMLGFVLSAATMGNRTMRSLTTH